MELLISLDRESSISLRDQLYDGLRRAMIDGRLAPGGRIPATRVLAARLRVSRLTVEDAYARLVAEGYLEARRGSGTFVTCDAPGPPPVASHQRQVDRGEPGRSRQWSAWGTRLSPDSLALPTLPVGGAPALQFSFRSGMPAMDAFPHALWNRTLARAARQVSLDHRDYGPSNGFPPLRAAISSYLSRSRGLPLASNRVVVTSGFQQALDLLTRLLVDPGDMVAIEEPCYPGAHRAFVAAGARVVSIPVDADGMRVELVDELAPAAKLVYVTPSHQYPTGGILSLPRRWALLNWAQRHGSLVLEDDYDAEFRYGARPVPALAGLDPGASNVVAYLGTFSKVLYPSLRLGYAVLPPDLVDHFVAAKRLADYHSPTLEQVALAAFIEAGHFERHLARMRRLYAARRAALLDALSAELAEIATWDAAAAFGLHVLVGIKLDLTEAELVARAAQHGVGLDPAGPCYVSTPPRIPSVLLGYATLPEEQIRLGIRTLARSLGPQELETPCLPGPRGCLR